MIGNIYVITAIAVIGGSLFGFDLSSMSAIIGTRQYNCYFNQGPHGPPFDDSPNCSGPRSDIQGGITASMPGGSFIGALLSGVLSDRLGRKSAIQVGSVIWIVGSIIICATQNIPMLMVGRFINGLSVGICSAQVPVYVAELAPPHRRGLVVGTQQWAITWGILIMFYLSYGCSFLDGNISFRLPWGLQMIPAILLFFGLLLLPESPRWLAGKDRWEDCHNVLALVHGKGDLNDTFVQVELQQLKETCDFERSNPSQSYLELFQPNMIWRTHIGVSVQIWSQLSGINVIMLYITYVFGMTGLSGNANLVASSISYVINMVVTIVALLYVDRVGRRFALIGGGISLTIWWFVCAGLMGSYGSPAPPGGLNNIAAVSWLITGAPSKAVIACSYLVVASFAPTWGPVSWIYPPELFPLRLRGKAVALATSSNWIFNFALSYFVPPAFVNIKWKTYIIFGVFSLAMTIHCFLCFPETSGKTLEEIEELFSGNTRAWRTGVAKNRLREMDTNDVELEGIKAPVHLENVSDKSKDS
ncbi:Uncharacterized protein BP5553_05568 [Venustampulla echinocandica]|uniref:Major facilitator superfamily (MFS) profile domain-containing protein n=1 Tax=Venustampulla echinocandica TaxID=2656787 RepID=A0A370TRH4_9HELO|nr:Uncharacterized protein BP5553_05568 [Venustampulla echinocandica]RDL38135.1 Uncharacterized protein BP5553_05568 [Venustampulla echinocandica]